MNSTPITEFRMAVRQGRIEPHFQPIVDLRTGSFHALEARARWNLPGEMLKAREVLARAREVGQLIDLDFAILVRAIADVKALSSLGVTPLCLAVNFASETVLDPAFPERLDDTVRESGMRPGALRLEFPLESFEADAETLRGRVRRAATQGFGVAVDHVRDPATVEALLDGVPVGVVKLDESLVARVPEDAVACETVRAIVSAAERRGAVVGVEGIGRIGQIDWLKSAGCVEGQGMLICRPGPMQDLAPLLQRGRCW